MELLSGIVLWWYWIVFGLVLLIFELLSGTFFILVFSVAALIVGVVTFLTLLAFNFQLILWIVLCIIGVGVWYKWLKGKTVSKSGQSDYRLDTKGVVTQKIEPYHTGRARFDTPVLGNREWPVTSDEEIDVGERIEIEKVNGQLIKVKRI